MPVKGQPLIVHYIAWNTSDNKPQTGNGPAHVMTVIIDSVTSMVAQSAVTEAHSVNCPGVYMVSLNSAEMNGNFITLTGYSSTAGVVIMPVQMATERARLAELAEPGDQMDLVNAPNSVALNAMADAMLNRAGWTAGGATSVKAALKALLAMAKGRVIRSGNSYTFYDDDGSTAVFTLHLSPSQRTTT